MYAVLVEGGKTKTLSVVVDEHGHVIGYAVSGSSGWTTVGFEKAFENLVKSIINSVRNCSLEVGDVDLAVLGLPDLDTEDAKEYFVNKFKSTALLKKNPVIVPDFVTAYYAITLGNPGIAVIAGTGSIAYGKNSRGVSARSGGWGWFGGDEGSALWIAMKAMGIAGKAFDGRGPETLICKKLIEFFKIKDPLQLINIIYMKAREDIGELGLIARLVDEAAEDGDLVAQEILVEGGKELALMAKAVYDKIYVESDLFTVGGVGSVYLSKTLRKSFMENLRKFLPKVDIVEPITHYMPIIGLAAILIEKLQLPKKVVTNVEKEISEVMLKSTTSSHNS